MHTLAHNLLRHIVTKVSIEFSKWFVYCSAHIYIHIHTQCIFTDKKMCKHWPKSKSLPKTVLVIKMYKWFNCCSQFPLASVLNVKKKEVKVKVIKICIWECLRTESAREYNNNNPTEKKKLNLLVVWTTTIRRIIYVCMYVHEYIATISIPWACLPPPAYFCRHSGFASAHLHKYIHTWVSTWGYVKSVTLPLSYVYICMYACMYM